MKTVKTISMAVLWAYLDKMKINAGPDEDVRAKKAAKVARRSAKLRSLMYRLDKMGDWDNAFTVRVKRYQSLRTNNPA